MTKDNQRDIARQLLIHYFRTVWTKAGLKWTSDNDAEIDALVEVLID